MSISAPALPFDLACKGTFTDAAGIPADSAAPVACDPLQTFARVLAGTTPAAAGVVVPTPDRCGTVAVQPTVVSEPAAMASPVPAVESPFGPAPTELTGSDFGPGRPSFSRHDFSHTPSASPVAVFARGLTGSVPEHRRHVIESGPATPVALEACGCDRVDSADEEIDLQTPSEDPTTVETTAVTPAPTPLTVENQPVVAAVALPVPVVPPAIEGQELLAPECNQSAAEASPVIETADTSAASVPSGRPQQAKRAYRQSESRAVEKTSTAAEKQVRTETDLATDKPVAASTPDKATLTPIKPGERKGRAKSEGETAVRSLEQPTRAFGNQPVEKVRSTWSDELPTPVKAELGDTAAVRPTDLSSLPTPVKAERGDRSAISNRGTARSEGVRANPTFDQAPRPTGWSPPSRTSVEPLAESMPAIGDQAGPTGVVANETTDSDQGGGEIAVTPDPTDFVVPDAVRSPHVAPPASPILSEDDSAVPAEVAVTPRSVKELPGSRSARFAAGMSRPMSERAIAVAAPGSVPGRMRVSEPTEISEPVEAPGEATPVLDGESAWRRLPMSVRESLTVDTRGTKPGAVAPAWTPFREKFAPAESIQPIDSSRDIEPLVALESAALELSGEMSAGVSLAVPTANAAPLARRSAEAGVAEKFAAEAATSAPTRAYQRARSGLESKISTVVAAKDEVTVNKFALGTETAEQRPLMHPEASFVRKPSVREESISTLMGTASFMSGELAGFARETAQSAPPMSTAQGVREVVDAADKLWATDRPSVNFKLTLDDVGVAVRVEYREGEVTATFQTDSPELRERLAAAWQVHVASTSDQKPYRVADPVFTAPASSSSGGMPGGQDFSSGGDTARQFAQSRQSETPAWFSGQSSSRSAADAPVTEARIPASTATSLRLHAFA